MSTNLNTIRDLAEQEYKWGFVTAVEAETSPKGTQRGHYSPDLGQEEGAGVHAPVEAEGLSPLGSLEKAQAEPNGPNVKYGPIDYQDIVYYSAPKQKPVQAWTNSIRRSCAPTRSWAFRWRAEAARRRGRRCGVRQRLGATTFKEKLAELGIIFCSFSEAVRKHPELVKKYLGSVVPYTDNFFAALNSAVFSDGSFCLYPEGRALPDGALHLLPHQRGGHRPVRAHPDHRRGRRLRQLPRRLHRADARREPAACRRGRAGCAHNAQIKYSTVQNWYPGDKEGKGGIYNFVTKRGMCRGANSKISWTQVETGSAITWKYPSCILQGDDSVGEFYSVALTNN